MLIVRKIINIEGSRKVFYSNQAVIARSGATWQSDRGEAGIASPTAHNDTESGLFEKIQILCKEVFL